MVDRERHIDDDRHLRADASRTDSGSAPAVADLLLRRRDGNDLRGAGFGRVASQSLEHHERADSVVDRAGHGSAVRKLHRPGIDHARISDQHHLLRLLLRLRAEVHPQLGELCRLLALFGLDQMDGLLADDPESVAFLADEPDALANQYLRVPSADRLDVRVALIVDVVDDDADLVDVAGEHDRRSTRSADFGEAVTGDVAADGGKLSGVLAPDLGGGALETGGPWCIEEFLKEAERIGGDHWDG